jgi:serine/threonine-protein kinase
MAERDERGSAEGERGGSEPVARSRTDALAETAIGESPKPEPNSSPGDAGVSSGSGGPSAAAWSEARETAEGAGVAGLGGGAARSGSGDRDAQPGSEPVSDGAPEDEGPDPYLGRVLSGIYKVQDRIGEGGMGTVYLALHVHLNKPFAIKVLSPKVAADGNALARFRQEAIAASSIDHENIIDIVNFDATSDGDVFIVMELLKGQSLAGLLAGGRLSLGQALRITYQLCSALGAAHAEGIVHRDLKPENVFVVPKAGEDVAKVLDFGISKVKSAEAEEVRMTRTGQLVGTPLYMSPEQARGDSEIDRRADIYALGCILYEMLTGTAPFSGNNYFQLLWKHGNERPEAPTARAPEASIPKPVEAVVLRTLEKDPDKRFDSMAELQQALMAAAPDVSLPLRYLSTTPRQSLAGASEARRPIRRRWTAGAAVALLLSGVGIGAFALRDAGRVRPAPVETAGTSRDETPAAAAGDSPDEAQPEPEAEALPEGVDVPPAVAVRFDSRPSGAEVLVDGEPLGETPLEAQLPRTTDPLEVRFSRRGYADEVITVVPEEGMEVVERLKPRTRRRRQRPSSGSLPIKKEL